MNTLLRLGGSRGPLQLRPASPLCWRAAGAGGLLQQQQQQQLQQQRHLSLHEYQALQLLREFNVPMPMFSAAHTPEEAYTAAVQMQQQQQQQKQQKGSKGVVVKAQVLAGGRGLGYFKENGYKGGVHCCSTAEEVREAAKNMLGNTLITKQTGDQGRRCSVVLICERLQPKKEFYLALLLDRETGGPLLVLSAHGGTSIEDIAKSQPDSIVKIPIDAERGIDEGIAERVCNALKISYSQNKEEALKMLKSLYAAFKNKDCLLLEINPLMFIDEGILKIADIKLQIDDSAQYRQSEVYRHRDISQEDPQEIVAEQHGLNYIKLKGDIGCLVNGAGLAMATMDLLTLKGGSPANFLDVGGAAQQQQITQALHLLQTDTQVKAIFINIFGGIMKCDLIAKGLIEAAKTVHITKPLVVRLEGTNKEQAETLLADAFKTAAASGQQQLHLEAVSDLDAAAARAVELAAQQK